MMKYISIHDNGVEVNFSLHVSLEEMQDHCRETNYIPYTLSRFDLKAFENRLEKRNKIIMIILTIVGIISLLFGCSL